MKLVLVHHAEAVGPEVDTRRPLSSSGAIHAERIASQAAARGVRPEIIWHSGKLRARQTAQAFWRACNPLAAFSASPDLQPDDPPSRMRDRLFAETRDVLIAGHMPHLQRLLSLLLGGGIAERAAAFPPHGVVALETKDEGTTWTEAWRIET